MGYYIFVEVYRTTPNNQHWVAIDNIDNNTIIMYDPASSDTSMWDKYDWNKTSQFVYFKVIGQSILANLLFLCLKIIIYIMNENPFLCGIILSER